MKNFLKKIFLTAATLSILVPSVALAATGIGGGVSTPVYFIKDGTALRTSPDGLDLGTVANPVGDIYAGALNISGLSLTGAFTITVDDANALLVETAGGTDIFNVDTVAGDVNVDTISEMTASAGVTIDGMNIANDGTTTTFLGTSGDYNRIGDASTSSHSFASEDDTLFTGQVEIDSNTYLDGFTQVGSQLRMTNDQVLVFGSAGNTSMDWSTAQTSPSLVFGTGDTSKTFILTELADVNADFGHANKTNPTFIIQSADATTPAQNIQIFHDQANANMNVGAGLMIIDAPAGVALQDSNITVMTFTADGTKATLVPSAGDYARFGDATTTSHALASNDDLLFTGLTEHDGVAYFDNQANFGSHVAIGDGQRVFLGAVSADFSDIHANSGLAQTVFELGSSNGRHIVFGDPANFGKDYDHALQTNPTVFIHSATDPDTDNTQWGSLAHDQTNFVIGNGKGRTVIDAPVGQSLRTAGVASFETYGDATKSTWLTNTGSYIRIGDAGTTSHGLTDNDDALVTQHFEVDGTLFKDGVTVNDPSTTQVLVAGTGLTVSKSLMRIDSGAAGAVTMTATPTIVDGTDGTCVIIQGDDDTNTVKFQDESNLANSGLQLSGGTDFTFGKGDTLEVCYDLGDDNWYEISRSDN